MQLTKTFCIRTRISHTMKYFYIIIMNINKYSLHFVSANYIEPKCTFPLSPINHDDDIAWPPFIWCHHPARAKCLGRESSAINFEVRDIDALACLVVLVVMVLQNHPNTSMPLASWLQSIVKCAVPLDSQVQHFTRRRKRTLCTGRYSGKLSTRLITNVWWYLYFAMIHDKMPQIMT